MAIVYRCDRCQKISDSVNVEELPEGWVVLSMPVRGSQGARSRSEQMICTDCDDALYDWLTYDEAGNVRRARG